MASFALTVDGGEVVVSLNQFDVTHRSGLCEFLLEQADMDRAPVIRNRDRPENGYEIKLQWSRRISRKDLDYVAARLQDLVPGLEDGDRA
ncbi:hypothetical protein ACFCX4_08970 [Kitasatospora sp. NPDC056327]|uniref:hypothetical protein n=1 Tax=Kitasatospora sp. NPDC056327 TaxID=3345785 RepID=UPI0035DD2B2E